MWDLNDIKIKKKYIIERFKQAEDELEKEKLKYSLISNIALLENSGTFRYTRLYNLIDILTNSTLTFQKDKEIYKLEQKIIFESDKFMDESYLEFLLELCKNVASSNLVSIRKESFIFEKTNEKKLLEISENFYKSFDKELYKLSKRCFNDPTCFNFTNFSRKGMEDLYGITFYDYIFNKAYFKIVKKDIIIDYQTLNHEVMHGIDFYMKQKVPSINYHGFHEVPTYTIDYFFIDFLEENDFDKEQVQFLRKIKDNYLQGLAIETLIELKKAILFNCGITDYENVNIDIIKNSMSNQILKQLLEIESGVIAYGLYQQITEDKEHGLNNLKQFMKSIIPYNERPNFSKIEFSDEKLLELSHEIGFYSLNHENTKRKVKTM